MDQDLESDHGDHHHLLDYGEAVTNSHNYNIFILKFYIITASSWHWQGASLTLKSGILNPSPRPLHWGLLAKNIHCKLSSRLPAQAPARAPCDLHWYWHLLRITEHKLQYFSAGSLVQGTGGIWKFWRSISEISISLNILNFINFTKWRLCI